jgi:hypothetical protein
MKIQNQTQNELFYTISSPGTVDCGKIESEKIIDVGYNNSTDVRVWLSPVDSKSLQVVIPQTGTGKTVTVGMYFE